MLGLLLFDFFLCDLFLFVEEADIMSYADDNSPYVCCENFDVTLEKLEEVGKIIIEWFLNNFLKTKSSHFNPLSANPTNGQTHSNNLLAKANELFECV